LLKLFCLFSVNKYHSIYSLNESKKKISCMRLKNNINIYK